MRKRIRNEPDNAILRNSSRTDFGFSQTMGWVILVYFRRAQRDRKLELTAISKTAARLDP